MNPTGHPVDRLPDLAAGRMADADAAAVNAHILECAACSADLAELEALVRALAPDRTAEPAPVTFAAILHRLDREGEGAALPPADPASPLDLAAARDARRRGRRPAALGLLATAAALVAFVVVAVTTIGGSDDDPPVAAPGAAPPDGDASPPDSDAPGGGAPAPGTAPDLLLLTAAETAEALDTVRFTTEGVANLTPSLGNVDIDDLGVDIHISAEGAHAAPDRFAMDMVLESSGTMGAAIPRTTVETVTVGDRTRSRTDGGPWEDEAGGVDLDLPNVEDPALMLREAAENAERVGDGGTVTVNGHETREVSFTVPAYLIGLDALFDDNQPVDVTVYIMDGGALSRAVVSVTGDITRPIPGEMSMELTTDYFDHDEPVDIRLP